MKNNKGQFVLFTVFIALTMMLSVSNSQGGTTGLVQNRTIEFIGCDGINCYIKLVGSAVGPSACSSAQVRFRPSAITNGQIWYSSLLAAHLAGRQINIFISGTCYTHQNSYPTLEHFHVK